jgi:hypothetical protein
MHCGCSTLGLGSIYVFLVSHPRSGCETAKRREGGARVLDLGAEGAQVRAASCKLRLAPQAPTSICYFTFRKQVWTSYNFLFGKDNLFGRAVSTPSVTCCANLLRCWMQSCKPACALGCMRKRQYLNGSIIVPGVMQARVTAHKRNRNNSRACSSLLDAGHTMIRSALIPT